jgi:hypothetical protein
MINCAEIDIPEDFNEFAKLMAKHKEENHTLLVNIDERWYTAEIRHIKTRILDLEIVILGYDKCYIYDGSFKREYYNLFRNATYYIEDMFYKIAHAHA